jgi:hypothetical protein
MSECELWTGTITQDGYGQIKIAGRSEQAHRHAYRQHHGDIPADHDIHHTCGEKRCVNPKHLTPITRSEHATLHRAFEVAWQAKAAQTHCKQGHEFTPENTYRRSSGGRACRACQRIKDQRRRTRRRTTA